MRFGIFFELQLPRPWGEDSERQLFTEALEQIELADRLGFDYAWCVEHHFLEEYSHCSSPELLMAAASQRTRNIRLGHGVLQMHGAVNHPIRIAERVATLDILSGGRVDFGTGEPSSETELGGFCVQRADKRRVSEDAIDAVTRMFVEEPFAGWNSDYLTAPPRNILPKPLQKPHPPLWIACSKRETIHYAARRGVGALSFAFLEPEFATRIVADYRQILTSDQCVPAGFAVNPNVAVVLPMHCHDDEQVAVDRGLIGAEFFEFAKEHYYRPKRHYPGRTNLYRSFAAQRQHPGGSGRSPLQNGKPVVARGAIGTPRQLVDVIDRYERVGVDQLIFLTQAGVARHEDICESLELFAGQVLCRYTDGRAEQEKIKAERIQPAIAAAMSRRPPARVAAADYCVDVLGSR
jgi:alkanesulfonate monooxygenase SsuD/methylene tetrahydromethanopterin reductase-like flavin-dependent oxidoreductase (luciferase family)